MHRRALLLATGVTAATAIAGCQSITGGDGPAPENGANPSTGSTISSGPGDSRIVIVTNTGEVTGDPDLAVLEVGIEITGDTAGNVRSELAARSDEVTSALRDYGIPEDAISTRQFRIDERLDRRRMEEDGVRPGSTEDVDEYRYFVGVHSLTVEVEAIDEAGEVVDVAVDAGATDVDRVTYTLSDEKRSELRETAVRRALRNARTEADAIADEVDGRIVEATIVDASEGEFHPVTRDVAFERATRTPAATPGPQPGTRLEPGEVTVTARVRVKYTME